MSNSKPQPTPTLDAMLNETAEASERIGYMRAIIELIDEMNRVGLSSGAVAIALFVKAKGIAK